MRVWQKVKNLSFSLFVGLYGFGGAFSWKRKDILEIQWHDISSNAQILSQGGMLGRRSIMSRFGST